MDNEREGYNVKRWVFFYFAGTTMMQILKYITKIIVSIA
jgi:hypothetical protein